ncbi:hypothetical protein D1872_152740 [compost metagenome]
MKKIIFWVLEVAVVVGMMAMFMVTSIITYKRFTPEQLSMFKQLADDSTVMVPTMMLFLSAIVFTIYIILILNRWLNVSEVRQLRKKIQELEAYQE